MLLLSDKMGMRVARSRWRSACLSWTSSAWGRDLRGPVASLLTKLTLLQPELSKWQQTPQRAAVTLWWYVVSDLFESFLQSQSLFYKLHLFRVRFNKLSCKTVSFIQIGTHLVILFIQICSCPFSWLTPISADIIPPPLLSLPLLLAVPLTPLLLHLVGMNHQTLAHFRIHSSPHAHLFRFTISPPQWLRIRPSCSLASESVFCHSHLFLWKTTVCCGVCLLCGVGSANLYVCTYAQMRKATVYLCWPNLSFDLTSGFVLMLVVNV